MISKGRQMVDIAVIDLDIPMEILIVMIRRKGKLITPRGEEFVSQ
jgi:Trk K+ transport system NAD-binding subunit